MNEGHNSGIPDPQRRVRVGGFPTYREVRHLLGVWPARSTTQITKLHRMIMEHVGSPDDPVDWSDPDAWIPEWIPSEHHELAYAIWKGSNKTVNPRYTAGSWSLVRHYRLLAEDADGKLRLTDRGHDFIDQPFGDTETLVDEQEGLIRILSLVADSGPASFGGFVDPWDAHLKQHSNFGSPSTIRDTLRRRLRNLLDRDLVSREDFDYSITKAGLDYLKRAGSANGVAELPYGVTKYADDEVGRAILEAVADSIEFANSLNPECWAGRVTSARDLRFYVGQNIMMLPHASSMRTEITLLPAALTKEDRESIQTVEVRKEYQWPEGARRYLLEPEDFVERWPAIRKAHRKAIKQAAGMKTPRADAHRTDVVEFLNRTLGTELPQPGYVVTSVSPQGGGSSDGGFRELTQSLQKDGLLFSKELVANYILALQTKRFAILTGISGTGKTKIAMAVAQHFEHSEQRRVDTIPDDSVGIDAMPYMFKNPRIMIPVVVAANLDLLGPDAPLAARQIGIRYPEGSTTLTYHRDERGATALLFRGEFKEWFRSNVTEGHRIWLRVREGETPDSDELEIGLSETEVVEQPLENHVVIPVRPDWVDNRGLLGYLNPLTGEYSTTTFLNLLRRARAEEERAADAGENPHPFFVILDEMNLARVEHYFSDFLSALESGEDIPLHENEAIESGEAESGPRVPRKLRVPGNVLFTGTVNVDETTYMFSPKVLDRAFTIEFDRVDLEGFTEGVSTDETSGLHLDGVHGSLDLLPSRPAADNDWKPSREDWVEFSKETGEHHEALLRLHDILEAQHRHFGYRVANEIARFVNLAREQGKDVDAAVDAAFDLALLQKVLPKLHGTQQELEPLLKEIFRFAVHGGSHVPKKNRTVELEEWKVVKGHLVGTPKAGAPSQTRSSDATTEGDKTDSDAPKAGDTGTPSPAYPRTGAKVLRMLNRLRDRGFTSFVE